MKNIFCSTSMNTRCQVPTLRHLVEALSLQMCLHELDNFAIEPLSWTDSWDWDINYILPHGSKHICIIAEKSFHSSPRSPRTAISRLVASTFTQINKPIGNYALSPALKCMNISTRRSQCEAIQWLCLLLLKFDCFRVHIIVIVRVAAALSFRSAAS